MIRDIGQPTEREKIGSSVLARGGRDNGANACGCCLRKKNKRNCILIFPMNKLFSARCDGFGAYLYLTH